jgi:uncharacterized protein (TIGR02646 family)
MTRVQRTGKPKILTDNEVAWKAAIAAAANAKARKKAQGHYCRKPIKKALVDMFHGKCAYCESAITHIDYGHIEHFKPKSRREFSELAVDWNNLLLACGVCNGAEFKGVNFPGPREEGPLIDPTAEDPSPHFKFDYDSKTRVAAVLGITGRGRTTVKTFGLDRPALVKRRSNFVTKLIVIAKSYATDPEAKAIIDAAVVDTEEYLAFAIQIRNSIV